MKLKGSAPVKISSSTFSTLAFCCVLMSWAVGCGSGSEPVASKEASQNEDLLAAGLGFGGSSAEQQARYTKIVRKSQKSIADCMRTEGFEYVPFVPSNGQNLPPTAPQGGEVEWKRTNGYGYANSIDMGTTTNTLQEKDPNDTIRSALSEADLAAYQKALFGFDPTSPQSGTGTSTAELSSCQAKGFGGQELSDAYRPLESKFEELQKRIASDPRSAQLFSKWSGCMKKAGFIVARQEDVYKLIDPEYTKLYSSTSAPVSAAESTESLTAANGPEVDPGKLAEFRKFELKVANADADCLPQKGVNELRSIGREYEQAFVDANRAQLQKIKALTD
jgi:hypothetical protein